MLKISEAGKENNSVTLKLEGRVVDEWVGELQKNCDPLLGNGSRLALDLAGVSFLDESGVALLASLRSRGTKLLNATPFVIEQLKGATGISR